MINLTNGHVQSASSTPIVPNGYMELYLNTDATVIASPYGQVLGGTTNSVRFYFDSSADLITPAQIWSNAELNPQSGSGLGTWYVVNFYDQSGTRLNNGPMNWVFTQSNGTTVDIGTMTNTSENGPYFPIPITYSLTGANLFFTGPVSGSPALQTFRAIVPADLPLATNSAFGAVKPDGATITISGGVITSVAGGIEGSGTTGKIPVWTGASVLANSNIDDGLTTAGTVTITEPTVISGHAAIGSLATIDPNTVLVAQETTAITSGFFTAFYAQATALPTAASDATYFGFSSYAMTDPTDTKDYTGNLNGGYFGAYHQGTGSFTGDTGYLIGVGSDVENLSTGHVALATGFDAFISNSSTGIIDQAEQIHVGTILNSGGGTIATGIGLVIDDQTQAITNFAIKTGKGQVFLGDQTTIIVSPTDLTGFNAFYVECDLSPTVPIGAGRDLSGCETDMYVNLDGQSDTPGQLVAQYEYAENDGNTKAPSSFLGFFGEVVQAGSSTLPLAVGAAGHVQATAGTITAGYALQAKAPGGGGGTIVTAAGLHIEAITGGGTNYQIKSDGTALSLFAGPISITAGGLTVPLVVKTANYNIATATDTYIICKTNAFTVTLPTAVGISGRAFVVKNGNPTTNSITLATTSSQTIDATTPGTIAPLASVKVVSDGSNWWLV